MNEKLAKYIEDTRSFAQGAIVTGIAGTLLGFISHEINFSPEFSQLHPYLIDFFDFAKGTSIIYTNQFMAFAVMGLWGNHKLKTIQTFYRGLYDSENKVENGERK